MHDLIQRVLMLSAPFRACRSATSSWEPATCAAKEATCLGVGLAGSTFRTWPFGKWSVDAIRVRRHGSYLEPLRSPPTSPVHSLPIALDYN